MPVTYAITRVKDEVDIIEYSLRRMLRQVDHIIVGYNSSDGTIEKIEELIDEGHPIYAIPDHLGGTRQREVMNEYARIAFHEGAKWVLPYDTDEVWYSDKGPIKDALDLVPHDVKLVTATNTTHCATSADDPSDPDAFSRMGWRDKNILPLGKVACRTALDIQIDHGNHACTYASDSSPHSMSGIIAIRHFPYRTPTQLVKRVEAVWPDLKASGLPESHGNHMRLYGRVLEEHGPEGLFKWFMDGMFFTNPETRDDITYDPCP